MPAIEPFDPNSVDPNKALEAIKPAGWYSMDITKTEVVRAKDNQQHAMLKVHLTIDASRHPEHRGRVVIENLNLWNSNETAVRIARGDLSAICRACGYMQVVENTDVLHGRRLAVKLGIRPATEKYSEQNDVKGYDSIESRFSGGPVNAADSVQRINPNPAAAPQPLTPPQPQTDAQPAPQAAPPQTPSAQPPWQQ